MATLNLKDPRRGIRKVYKPQERRTEDNSKFYNSPIWRRVATQFRNKYPLCAHCAKNGKMTPATVTDHIIPLRLGGPALDMRNLQSLCESCHARKSAGEKYLR